MKEQRQFIRVDKSFEVAFYEVNEFLHSGSRSKNISEGGICLPVMRNFAVGTLLKVEIRSNDFKVPVKALARVTWIARREKSEFPFDAGLEFLEITPSQRDLLRDCVNRYAAEGPGQQEISWVD